MGAGNHLSMGVVCAALTFSAASVATTSRAQDVSISDTSTPAAAAVVEEPSAAELEEARRLFRVGLEHADRAEWTDAVTCFRQALEVRAAPPVLFNLGAALVALGQYPEAEQHLARVVDDPSVDEALRGRARASIATMESLGGRIAITVRDQSPSSIVYLDGSVLPPSMQGREIYLAAGEHDLLVREGAEELLRRAVRVSQGDRAEVVVSLAHAHEAIEVRDAEHVAAHDARAERTRVGSTLDPDERRRQRLRNPWLWTGVTTALLLAGGAVFWARYEPGENPAVRGDFDDPLLRF